MARRPTWKDEEWQEALIMRMKGISNERIGLKLGKPPQSVCMKFHHFDGDRNKPKENLATKLGECIENGSASKIGKINPYAAAKKLFGEDVALKKKGALIERKGIWYYHGKLLKGYLDWWKVFRDMNAIRKQQGLAVIDYSKEWL